MADFTLAQQISGSLDVPLDDIRVKELPHIAVDSNGTFTVDTSSKLESNSTVAIGLDDIRVKELPRIEVGSELSFKPTRVHLPLNYRLSFSALGVEWVCIALCGEGMAIIEDYIPHRAERCS